MPGAVGKEQEDAAAKPSGAGVAVPVQGHCHPRGHGGMGTDPSADTNLQLEQARTERSKELEWLS